MWGSIFKDRPSLFPQVFPHKISFESPINSIQHKRLLHLRVVCAKQTLASYTSKLSLRYVWHSLYCMKVWHIWADSSIHNLFVFLKLRLVYLPNLCQLGSIVHVLNGALLDVGERRGTGRGAQNCWVGPFLRTSQALGDQHVVQAKQLRIHVVLLTCRMQTQP